MASKAIIGGIAFLVNLTTQKMIKGTALHALEGETSGSRVAITLWRGNA